MVGREGPGQKRTALVRFAQTYRGPLLAGALIGTCYIPFPPWSLFFCIVPLFVFWRKAQNLREVLIAGWLTQFFLTLIGFHWIAYTAVEFGRFPLWLGGLTLLAFCAIAHLYFPLAGAVWYLVTRQLKIDRDGLPALLLMGGSLAFFERTVWALFPWHLGYTWLWARFPAMQTADVWGFEGLSYFTIFANALLAWALIDRWRWRLPRAAAVVLLAFGLVNAWGVWRKAAFELRMLGTGDESEAALRALVVQGNIGNLDKLRVETSVDARGPVTQKYLALSSDALERVRAAGDGPVDLVVWPETAYPGFLNVEQKAFERFNWSVREAVRGWGVSLLAGSYSRPGPESGVYNGMFLLGNDGENLAGPYHKTILLAFGEKFPFNDIIPYQKWLLPNLGTFGEGSGPRPIQFRDIMIGPQICYEGLYPWFTADLVRAGARVIVNVTNDSWFGRPFEPLQHMTMTLARAIEFRRPLIRSTNTGISTAIEASGEQETQSPLHQEWTGVFDVRLPEATLQSPYTRWVGGDRVGLWIWILLAINVILILAGAYKRERP
jgi:apolipoprotein N-acyltransferase